MTHVEQAPLPDRLPALARFDPDGDVVFVLSDELRGAPRCEALAAIYRATRQAGIRPGLHLPVVSAIAGAFALRTLRGVRATALRPSFAITALLIVALSAASSMVLSVSSPPAAVPGQPGQPAAGPHGHRRRAQSAPRPRPAVSPTPRGQAGQAAQPSRPGHSTRPAGRATSPAATTTTGAPVVIATLPPVSLAVQPPAATPTPSPTATQPPGKLHCIRPLTLTLCLP